MFGRLILWQFLEVNINCLSKPINNGFIVRNCVYLIDLNGFLPILCL